MRIPIIMLHHIGNPIGKGLADWSISTSKFELLLNSIQQRGFVTTTFEEIAKNTDHNLSKKIILTFDDCYDTLFDYAIPELLKRNMKAVFSIPTAQIGGFNEWDVMEYDFAKVNLMNAEQLQYLAAYGMEIASHGKQHLRANQINENQFLEEISNSKQVLETLLDKKIDTFTYPYGEVPKNYKNSLKKVGYKYGLCIYQPDQNNYALRRIGIHQSDDAKSIAFKLSRKYQYMRILLDPLLTFRSLFKA